MTIEAFRSFARTLDHDIVLSEARSFDMLFADIGMSARVTLAPDDATVVTDIFVLDASLHYGGVRRTLVNALLTINGNAAIGADFTVGLDSRSFIVLTGRSRLAGLSADAYRRNLAFWLEQAGRLQDLGRAVAFQGGDHSFELENAN